MINQPNQPTILLAMTADADICVSVIANLEYCGFKVIDIINKNNRFMYPSLWAHIKIKFQQLILRQKYAKQKFKDQIMLKKYLAQMADYPEIDYALFIRADVFGAELIGAVKRRVKKNCVAYQWDGMNRFPFIWEIVGLFDRFFVFDVLDLKYENHHFLPTTNFYFDYDLTCRQPETHDFYYLGSHWADRMPLINRFCEFAQLHDWKLNFTIYSDKENVPKLYPVGQINWIKQPVTLQQNWEWMKQSRVLVDFVISVHRGLSLRVFEALGHRKKLITTNAEIIKYDFYHPDNIYVLTEHNFDGLPEFLAKPYHEIDPLIREKYGFSNWIRYVLDIQPHQKITLPQ